MSNLVKARVLLVDAEPLTRLGLMHLIKEQKTLCVCGDADTLPVARDWCLKDKPDVVVLDVAMGDGFGFIKEIALWSPKCRVVVLTALVDAMSVQRAFKSGACAYITKRDPLSSLVNALVGATRGEHHIGPLVEDVILRNLACGKMQVMENGEPKLSNRESEVFRLLGKGQSTKAVSLELGLSIKTIETHCQRIKEKLKLDDSLALRRHAILLSTQLGELGGKDSVWSDSGDASTIS